MSSLFLDDVSLRLYLRSTNSLIIPSLSATGSMCTISDTSVSELPSPVPLVTENPEFKAPHIPQTDPSNAGDTHNLNETFLNMEPVVEDAEGEERSNRDQDQHPDVDSGRGEGSFVTPPQSPGPSIRAQGTKVDTFDGYSLELHRSFIVDSDEENSDLGYEADEEEDDSISGSSTSGDIKDRELPSVVTSVPSVDSQKSRASSKHNRPHIPPKPPTVPRSSKPTGKWEFPLEAHAVVDEDRKGSRGAISATPSFVDTYGFLKPTSSHHKSHIDSRMSKLPRIIQTTPNSSPVTSEQNTATRSSSTGWRGRGKSRFAGKTPGSTSGSRLTRVRDWNRGSRSGSISEGHTSEGHQSPDYDGESKKKVDWYNAAMGRAGGHNK